MTSTNNSQDGKQESVQESLNDMVKTMERLTDLALSHAKKIGADNAKLATSASLQKRLVVENKEFSLANSLESRSLGILVHKDKKKGSASINTTNEDSVRKAVEDALALATYSVPDPSITLASREDAPPAKPLGFLFDAALAEIDLDEMQGVMQEVLARLVKDPRVALDRYEMQVDITWGSLANSLGMRQSERQTAASWSFFGMGRDGDQVTGFDYDGNMTFQKQPILSLSMDGAEAFVKKILGGLNPRQAPTYRGAVLFTPRAVQEMLVGTILYHIKGTQVMDGKSLWDKSVGKKVLSDQLTLADDPHDPRFGGATSYDGDGVPTAPRTLIDKGVLVQHLHDVYSAKRCQTRTTGTAGGPFALRFAPGTAALAQILKQHDQLLVVDRFSGNTDPVQGDFSGVAKASRLYSKGEDVGAVTETMIAGNFFEMANNILAVTKETELISGAFSSPWVLAGGISVTGS